jgi:hypothetical protein
MLFYLISVKSLLLKYKFYIKVFRYNLNDVITDLHIAFHSQGAGMF